MGARAAQLGSSKINYPLQDHASERLPRRHKSTSLLPTATPIGK